MFNVNSIPVFVGHNVHFSSNLINWDILCSLVFGLEKGSISSVSDELEVLSLILDLSAMSPVKLGVLGSENGKASSVVVNYLRVGGVIPDSLTSVFLVVNKDLGLLVFIVILSSSDGEGLLNEKSH